VDRIEEWHRRSNLAAYFAAIRRRSFSDLLLFSVTAAELSILIRLTPTFGITDWIYVSQHLMVFFFALTRALPEAQDRSLPTMVAIVIAYAYSYAQVIYLGWVPGMAASPVGGLVLVTLSACLSCASLLSLGRLFGVRPALRGLVTKGPYRIVRHPMYLAYVVGDIGYNLEEWNAATVLMVLAGWASLVWRIQAEDRVLSKDSRWTTYAARVPYRLIPGVW
jgi:protein-S-isoprenylcysteine O-methyltransferase Ste14